MTDSDLHRISVLLLFSSSELGGAERSLSRMVFASRDIDYQLATLHGNGPLCDWIRSEGWEPLVFGRGAVGSGLMIRSFWRLVCHIRRHPVDVIYVCGARASLILRIIRVLLPKLKIVHGVRWNPNSFSSLDVFLRLVENFTHRLMDGWITNSMIAKRTLVSHCGIPEEKISVIYNGLSSLPIDLERLVDRPREVLTVANLNPRKGYLEYLVVIKKVLIALPDTKFVFVGRDDMNGEIQRAIEAAGISEHVRCEGFQADVSPWLRRARVFVLPSLWNEGCPTAILEAMACSIPCVAFAIDGLPELVENEHQGLLLQSGDYFGMAAAIIQILTNDSKAANFGESGKARVNSYFRIEDTADLHSLTFKKLIFKSSK